MREYGNASILRNFLVGGGKLNDTERKVDVVLLCWHTFAAPEMLRRFGWRGEWHSWWRMVMAEKSPAGKPGGGEVI